MRRGFLQIDVFGSGAFNGNPLAVVLDCKDLSSREMQHFAHWTNLSETAFLLPPDHDNADYRVRIFTTARELSFAGHPTLGSCHAWLANGGVPQHVDRIVQQCGAGLVPIRPDGAGFAFAAPPLLKSGPVDPELLAQLVAVLQIAKQDVVASEWIDNGPGWIGVLLESAEAVLAVEPDFSRFTGKGGLDIGLIGAYPSGSECAFEVRALFDDGSGTMREDPVTGSLNASLAQWLLGSGRATAPYIVSQGTRLGRRGRPRIAQDDDGSVWIGGDTVTCINGSVDI